MAIVVNEMRLRLKESHVAGHYVKPTKQT